MNISITVRGDKEVKAKLRRLGASIYDMKRAMQLIGRDVGNYFSTQGFASQGGVFGSPWRQLNRRYAIRKAAEYPGRPPLVKTGEMKNSFEFEPGTNSVIIGNSSTHFKYHQSTLPRTRLPRRQMMGINEPVKRIIRQHIQDEVRRKIASV